MRFDSSRASCAKRENDNDDDVKLRCRKIGANRNIPMRVGYIDTCIVLKYFVSFNKILASTFHALIQVELA